ncbi:RTA1 like protein-domain-containing protein [Paraphoma chrysanthemicola]|uniref:RTA1 like protein-domain-containing protein n=1 Tax=Paraphoma chrysanthemicola TaxID=798071 RepID=A0A8K0QZH3_9PLEO|nr:RTA1 like protein-domain-containing protein [Paraphoma chrysanthemicola]
MPELQMYKGRTYLWDYVPNLPAAIAFAALFALLSIAHTWKMIRLRMWFCIPFVIGGACEVLGYISRAIATNNTGSLIPFLLQGIFLLLPPVFFAASLYMVYSRVVRAVDGDRFSIISPRWCTRMFVLGDWLCLNIQSTGGGLLANPKNVKIGDGIIVGGLILQCLIFVGFVYCCTRFHRRFRYHLTTSGERTTIPWEPILNMLYGTSGIIMVRNIYRLVEYIMGKGSYLFANEWPVYVLDGALMLVVMLVFFIWYPDQLQKNNESMIELTGEGETSIESGQANKFTNTSLPT